MEPVQLAVGQLPIFKIDNFSSHRHRHFQCVVANGDVFHRVFDTKAFYETFGYTKEISAMRISPDEYIWEIFTRAGAPRSRACLQRLIVHYLRAHSPEFKQLYGNVADGLLGQCGPDMISAASFCSACFMHPNASR